MIGTTRRQFLALGTAVVMAPAGGCMATAGSAGPQAASPLAAALLQGGYVVYFRHAATQWSGIDRIEWPRQRQRLLSDEGIGQSRTIGAAFANAGVPIGDVLASPFARCRDMAEIMFGRVDERMELIGLLSDENGRADRIAFLRRLVTTPPEPGTNRIVVSHMSNIAEITGVNLAEGEAVVLKPGRTSGFTTIGTAMPQDW